MTNVKAREREREPATAEALPTERPSMGATGVTTDDLGDNTMSLVDPGRLATLQRRLQQQVRCSPRV